MKEMNDEKKKLKERIRELEEEIDSRFYHADEEMMEVKEEYNPEISLTEHILHQRIEYLESQLEDYIKQNSELKENFEARATQKGTSPINLLNTTEFVSKNVFKRLQDSLQHANNNTEYLK